MARRQPGTRWPALCLGGAPPLPASPAQRLAAGGNLLSQRRHDLVREELELGRVVWRAERKDDMGDSRVTVGLDFLDRVVRRAPEHGRPGFIDGHRAAD